MPLTTLIVISMIFASANAGFRGGSTHTLPDMPSRGNQATQRPTLAYDRSFASISTTPFSTYPDSDEVSTSRMENRPITTTENGPTTESRYEGGTDNDDNPSYSYAYDVKDTETGDTKTHSESLENGVVKGSYSVIDPNGVRRTVHYTADAANGFNAVVNMEPTNVIIPTPKGSVQQYTTEANTESENPTTLSLSSTSKAEPTEATQGPLKTQVYKGSPLVYHAAPVVYRQPAPRVFYAPVASHQISHHLPRVAITTTPVAFAAGPVHKGAIYG